MATSEDDARGVVIEPAPSAKGWMITGGTDDNDGLFLHVVVGSDHYMIELPIRFDMLAPRGERLIVGTPTTEYQGELPPRTGKS